ncbi:MAG: hypothetical protein LQ351_004835 [Letrouitia transgressa]|nr:MAG: hypothetical protein LQ351_004835 [Letrouitia transgressa]
MESSTQTLLSPAAAPAAQPPSDEHSISLGKPSSKPRIDKKDISALLGSLACLILSMLTVLPYTSFPWHLGSKNQIVIVGVVLSIQNFCLQRVMQSSFILLEARLGKSVLQNYDAILRNQFIGSHVHPAWRVGLCTLTFLPTVLSVVYKQYLGGTSTAMITNDEFPRALYGLAYPDLGPYASLSNPIYLSINANAGFLNASRDDQEYPSGINFPVAYGYNTLVLSEDSAALLDLPLPTYITEIQERLVLNETWQVSADVDAIVATRNKSIISLRQDQIFLNQTMQHAYNAFASGSLFQGEKAPGLSFGWISTDTLELGDAYCLMGSFGNKSVAAPSPMGLIYDASDHIYRSFMESAQMFSIRRQGCHGKWEITQSAIKLLKAHCVNQSAVNSSILHDWQANPFAFDALPVLVNTISSFSTVRPNSPWKQISYVVAAANTWWARSAFLKYGTPDTEYILKYPETQYAPRNQSITSTRPTLDAKWGLYLVLVIFPFITLILFIPLPVLYSLPIGTGFGLVSILAGINRDTLDLVQGAGLSGKLDREVNLEISSEAVPNNKPEMINKASYRIRYALSDVLRHPIEAGIERGQEYE